MKVSVIIPAYNRLHTLPRVLDSFAAQTFSDWECIVVDDHSTDATRELVLSYKEKDNRFLYMLNTCEKGAQGARNCGIAAAQGEWIALFDSDDYAYSNFLEELTKKIADGVDVITSKARMIDSNTSETIDIANWCAEGNVLSDLLNGRVYIGYNGMLIRKAALERIAGTDTKCGSHQEYDTHIRLSQFCTYASTNLVLSDYYLNAADTITVDRRKHYDGYLYILLKHSKLFRRGAYAKFLKKAKSIWCSPDLPKEIKAKIRIRLLLKIPELPMYLICHKLKEVLR